MSSDWQTEHTTKTAEVGLLNYNLNFIRARSLQSHLNNMIHETVLSLQVALLFMGVFTCDHFHKFLREKPNWCRFSQLALRSICLLRFPCEESGFLEVTVHVSARSRAVHAAPSLLPAQASEAGKHVRYSKWWD